ncbi:restriction endonuclease subunit S [Tenacibaculum holothuriorum]|uniref:restriction endonuclease subunit S n=1 Tax=Tenacibaculum holothuriorum TaxID=1635173 RepID=UPI000A321AA6|nr:restriction endonuclease subunit S [Tenacibaculum holothuriorum]
MEKNLPKNWKVVNVSDFVSLLEIGGRPRGGVGKLTEGIPSISAEHFNYGGGFKFEKIKFITKEFYEKLKKGKIEKGDVLVVKDGATTGKSAYIDNKFPFDKAAVNEHTFIIRTYEGFENKLLFYFTLSVDFNNYILNTIGGSTIGGIKKGFINELRFNLPPLAEQKRIVAKLDEVFGHLDTLKTRLEKIPNLLKNCKQAILTQAVTGKLTEEWRKGKQLEEWCNQKIGDLIDSIDVGKSFKCPEYPVKKGQVGLVKISAVTWNVFNSKETKTVTDKSKINKNYFINSGDFLISRANTLELVGASVVVNEIEFDIMLSDKVWRVNFINDTIKLYAHRFLKSPKGRKEIESRATGNQLSMRNLSQNNFKDIDIPIPPKKEQTEIVKRVENLFAKLDTIEQQYQNLKTKIDRLPQAILAKAFKGELVAQLDTDGDAKKLLAEIQQLKASLTIKRKKKT